MERALLLGLNTGMVLLDTQTAKPVEQFTGNVGAGVGRRVLRRRQVRRVIVQ